jgi:hypothetical protein
MREAFIRTDDGTIPIRSYSLPLPKGDAGVELTVRLMNSKIQGEEGSRHPGVRAFAIDATRKAEDRDDWQQAQALFQAVKRKIRFRGEQDETVQTPWLTLQLGAGDCDDHTTLLVALLRSLGIPARIQTIALDQTKQFEHVFTMVGVRDHGRVAAWLPLDTTVPTAVPGWQPPNPTRRKVWGDESLRSGIMDDQKTLGMSFFKRLLQVGKIGAEGAVGFATGGVPGAIKAGTNATAQAVAKAKANKAMRHAAAAASESAAVNQVAVPGATDPTLGGYHRFDGREFRRIGVDDRRRRGRSYERRWRNPLEPNEGRRFDGRYLRGRLDPSEFAPRGRYMGDFDDVIDNITKVVKIGTTAASDIRQAVKKTPQSSQGGDGRNARQDQAALDQELARQKALRDQAPAAGSEQGQGQGGDPHKSPSILSQDTWIHGIPNAVTGSVGLGFALLLLRK